MSTVAVLEVVFTRMVRDFLVTEFAKTNNERIEKCFEWIKLNILTSVTVNGVTANVILEKNLELVRFDRRMRRSPNESFKKNIFAIFLFFYNLYKFANI